MEPKLFLAKDYCQQLVNEFGLYHYKVDAAGIITDDPEGEYDHWIDALRYPMTLLYGKAQIILGSGLIDMAASLTDPAGNFHRMPSPVEYAMTQGIRMNANEPDRSKLGKIGKPSELEDDPGDDDSTGGGGGFLWST